MVEIGFAQLLAQNTGVKALVGNAIQPIPAPEDLKLYPCVTYQVVSYTDLDDLDDGSAWGEQQRIIYTCWSQAAQDGGTYQQANTIRKAVRTALEGFSGELPDGTHVFMTKIDGKEDFFESESRQYRCVLHILVQYSDQ